jgi:hypothetical protein
MMNWREWLATRTMFPFISICRVIETEPFTSEFPGLEMNVTIRLRAVNLDHAKQLAKAVLIRKEVRELISNGLHLDI